MRRLQFLGLILIALMASSAALSSVAFAALPENLPTSAETRTWTGASDGATEPEFSFEGSAMSCKEMVMTGTEEAGKPLGLFHIECKGAKSGAIVCTGLGDAAGTILALGTWHLVFDQLKPELLTAIVLLFDHIHFNCSALVLFLILGLLICLHLKPTESNTTHLFHCNVEKMIDGTLLQEDKTYEDISGNPVTATLDCGTNEPMSEKPCFLLLLASMTYKEKIFADI